MTRRTYRYDEKADMMYEVGSNYFEEKTRTTNVISDDLGGINGLLNHADSKTYDSKSAFRKATQRAGCIEVGNEDMSKHVQKPELIDRREIGETVKRGFEEVRQHGDQAFRRARFLTEGR